MFRLSVKQLSKRKDSPIPLHPCIHFAGFGKRTKELHDLSILRGRQVRTPTLTCGSLSFNFIEYHSSRHAFRLEINTFCCNQCFKPWQHIFSTMWFWPRDKPANRRAKRNMEVLGPSHRSVFLQELGVSNWWQIPWLWCYQKGFSTILRTQNCGWVLNVKNSQYLLPIS